MCANRRITTWADGYRVAHEGVRRDYQMGDITRAQAEAEELALLRHAHQVRHARHTKAMRLWIDRHKREES